MKKIEVMETVSFFSKLFSYLENHPELLDEIYGLESKTSKAKHKDENLEPKIDVYAVYKSFESSEAAKNGLEKALTDLSIDEMKVIIKAHQLDTKNYYHKWKTKKRCIRCIVDKVASQVDKHDEY